MHNRFSIVILCFLWSVNVVAQDLYAYDVESKLEELNIILPELSKPLANYEHFVVSGNMLYLAGKGPGSDTGGNRIQGRLGETMEIEEGYAAAERVAIIQMAVMKEALGDLNRVKRVVKVLGMVNSAPDFDQQPAVVNGFSDMMVKVFGDRGRHARSAVGMVSLPSNIPVEIEAIIEFE